LKIYNYWQENLGKIGQIKWEKLKVRKQNNKLFCLFTQFQDSKCTLNYQSKKDCSNN
jgi:hypothetical protein